MSTQMTNMFSFRWRSWLGLGVALFLFWGAINVYFAVSVPVSLHQNGAGGYGDVLVLSPQTDTAFLGRSLTELNKADPRLGAFLVSFMDTMCAFMMAYAILQLGVVWFALRRGHTWALWTAAIAALATLPYYGAIIQVYTRFGVPVTTGDVGSLVGFTVIIIAATIFGWLGLRQGPRSAPASA